MGRLQTFHWLIVVVVCFAGSNAVAEEIRLDLMEEDFSNPGEPSFPAPPNWNQIVTNTTLTDLDDFNTGAGTGVDATTAGFDFFGFVNEIWTAGAKDWVPEFQGKSAGLISAGSATITFTNLTSPAYMVDVVASSVTSVSNTVGDYTVNGSFADGDFDGTGQNGDDYPLNGDGHNNWLIWDSVLPDLGQITIDMTFVSGTTWPPNINAVRLTGFAEGDTNLDGVVDVLDIDTLHDFWGGGTGGGVVLGAPDYMDLDNDGDADRNDSTLLVQTLVPTSLPGIGTVYGDSNLDSFRDLVDLNDWLANTSHVGGAAWAKGDWDGDGLINLVDLNIWLASPAVPTAPTTVTPEPTSLAMLAAGSILLLRRKRR